jgi:nucleotidyltransferase/DNA polymerase involved in DNA repair
LKKIVGEDGAQFLYNSAKGIDNERVEPKGPPKQVSCSMSLTPILCQHETAISKVIGYLALEIGN